MKTINNHLIHGFTYTLPVIILFSISLAIDNNLVALGRFPDLVFWCILPVLTMTIASSITRKITIVPGLLLGYWMNDLGVGFFGGILGGLLLGYIALLLCQTIRSHNDNLNVILGYILIGGLSLTLSYVLMRYVISIPVLWLLETINGWIVAIDPTQTIVLVGALAFCTVVDMGGPFNKVAFTFVLEFYSDGLYHIVGPAIISVAIPPLSMLAILYLFQHRIDPPSKSVQRLLVLGGIFGMTESAIPVVLEDPVKRWPAVILGSVAASVFAAYMGLSNILLLVSVPGLFGTSNVVWYLVSHVIGVGLVVLLVGLSTRKKPLPNTSDTV